MKKILFFIFVMSAGPLFSQTYSDMYAKAIEYRNQFKYIEALAYFQKLLKADSNNINYLTNASVLYCKTGNLQTDEKAKMNYFKTAEYLAKKSIAVQKENDNAHYAYALALGRINEKASSKEKIANAKLIKTEIDHCLKLNPKHAGAYHVLGRWHRTITGFSGVEKLAINTLYGGVPPGSSYDSAIEAFQNSIRYEPDYILHYYELALTYHERGKGETDKTAAITALKKCAELPAHTPDDPETKRKSADLLKKLGG